ncbi:hypothetical protein BDV12DRAFT_207761 [Aspergillus spectabilis]
MTYSPPGHKKILIPAARLMRGPPPSPPQSTDSDPASEVSQEAGDFQSMYGYQTAYRGAEQADDISFNDQSSVAMYINTTEYGQNVSLHHPMVPTGVQVNTPPDEGFVSGSLERTSPWQSPSRRPTPSRARVHKETRQRKRGKSSKFKETDLEIDLPAPLSVLTAHMTNIEVKDQEEHVNRPLERRLAEVKNKNGKISRSSNSFILYRSAYAERCKEYFRHQNHQIVSKVAGISWAMETPEIKEKYTRFADIEKANQKLAFPEYKYVPKKKDAHSDRSRRAPSGSPALHHSSVYSSPEIDHYGYNSGHSTASTPFDEIVDNGLPLNDGYFPASHTTHPPWPTSHPARPHSAMNLPSEPAQYIQPNQAYVHPGIMGYKVEDLGGQPSTLAGLPGGAHQDLFQPQAQISTPEHFPDGPLDPQLLELHHSQADSDSKNWQISPANLYFPGNTLREPSHDPYTTSPSNQPVMHTLGARDYDPSQMSVPEAAGSDFDGLLNNHHPAYQ